MVLDNVAYHHANRIKKWLQKHPKLELFFLPPYSPELNAIERAWWYMRKKITHNRYVKTLKERKAVFWKMFSHFLKPNNKLNEFVKSIIRHNRIKQYFWGIEKQIVYLRAKKVDVEDNYKKLVALLLPEGVLHYLDVTDTVTEAEEQKYIS